MQTQSQLPEMLELRGIVPVLTGRGPAGALNPRGRKHNLPTAPIPTDSELSRRRL